MKESDNQFTRPRVTKAELALIIELLHKESEESDKPMAYKVTAYTLALRLTKLKGEKGVRINPEISLGDLREGAREDESSGARAETILNLVLAGESVSDDDKAEYFELTGMRL